jgi:uncharacterized membrane protein YhaH (DUF805 family)
MTTPTTANHAPGRRTFWILWAIAVLTALVCVAFFIVGLFDGSVSSFNIGLWLFILFILGSTLLGSYRLRMAGFNGWAMVVVFVVAIPGLLFGFFVLVVLLSDTSWN